MKIIQEEDCDNLQFDTEGWITLAQFVEGIQSFLEENHIAGTTYDIGGEFFTFGNEEYGNKLELGAYVTADYDGCVNPRIRNVAICCPTDGNKFEFTLLGIDLLKCKIISSIPYVGSRCIILK